MWLDCVSWKNGVVGFIETKKGIGYGLSMLDWKQFFSSYQRSRSRLFVYLLALAFLVCSFSFYLPVWEFTFSTFLLCCCNICFTGTYWWKWSIVRISLREWEKLNLTLEIALAEKIKAREWVLYQQRSDAEKKSDGFAGLLYLVGPSDKDSHYLQSTLSCSINIADIN